MLKLDPLVNLQISLPMSSKWGLVSISNSQEQLPQIDLTKTCRLCQPMNVFLLILSHPEGKSGVFSLYSPPTQNRCLIYNMLVIGQIWWVRTLHAIDFSRGTSLAYLGVDVFIGLR